MVRKLTRKIAELYKIDSLDIARLLGYEQIILEKIKKHIPIRIDDSHDENQYFEPGRVEFVIDHGIESRSIFINRINIASYDLTERRRGIRRILIKKEIDPKEANRLEENLSQISDEKFFEMYNQVIMDYFIGMTYEKSLDNYEMRKRGQEFMISLTGLRSTRYRSVLWDYFNQLAKAIKP